MAKSIKRDGQWNPIIVRHRSDGKYDIIAGECRLRAINKLGLDTIEAKILNLDDDEAYLIAIKSNLVRRDMNPVEEGDGIKNLIEREWSVKKICKELNKSTFWIYCRLKLVEHGTEGLKNAVISKSIPLVHAFKVSSLPEGLQGPAVEKIIRERLNLKETSELVKLLLEAKTPKELERGFKISRERLAALANRFHRPKSLIEKNVTASNTEDGISIIKCQCGVRYIVDWDERQLVRAYSPKHSKLLTDGYVKVASRIRNL